MDKSDGRTILVVSHVVPCPPSAGNEVRILKIIQWLKSQGFRIVLLLNHHPLPAEREEALAKVTDAVHYVGDEVDVLPAAPMRPVLATIADKLAVALPDSRLYRLAFGMSKDKMVRSHNVKRYLGAERLARMTRHLCGMYRPFAVVAEYIFSAPCLDVVPPGTFRIIDTHDMFSRKKEQVLAYGIDDPLPCTPAEERRYLLKADLVLAIQSNEARMFRDLVLEREVITVGIDFDVVAEIDNSRVLPDMVLVVGSDNPLNVHGLQQFYKNAWPVIRAQRGDAVLRVVGKLAQQAKISDDSVQLVGWVPDLEEEYRKAAVVINPTMAGTGLKIKSVEALCRGKAFVGTANSVEGIEYAGRAPYLMARDWKEFSECVVMLLQSEERCLLLQHSALEYAADNFRPEVIYKGLGQSLARVGRML